MVEEEEEEKLPPPEEEEEKEEEEAVAVPQKPEWFYVLVSTNFWETCMEHAAENRAEQCMFCLCCHQVSCPHCTHNEPGHRRLKIRRYVYRSVVLAKDLHELGLDTYIINGQKVVHLRPMNRSIRFRPQAGTPRCQTCDCYLRTVPHLYCSLTCEGRVNVSQDDYSGPEAERRYRSLQTNMLQHGERQSEEDDEESEDDEEAQNPVPPVADQPEQAAENEEPPEAFDYYGNDEPPAATQNRSRRRRGRKQAEPARAPFF
nr:unnamed protein product [Digitaria exilis]